jgi:hypothetical protein
MSQSEIYFHYWTEFMDKLISWTPLLILIKTMENSHLNDKMFTVVSLVVTWKRLAEVIGKTSEETTFVPENNCVNLTLKLQKY